MQSKNAIGNLINRYKAVLKKCNLLNIFGTLAVISVFSCGFGLEQALARTPSLDDASTKVYLENLVDVNNNPIFTPAEVATISSAYSLEQVLDETKTYYAKFTVQEADASGMLVPVVYGISLKDPSAISAPPILNQVDINSVTGNFHGLTGNSGSAINNSGTINAIASDFLGNSATANAGAILNSGSISNLVGDFIGNTAYAGGAIFNIIATDPITGAPLLDAEGNPIVGIMENIDGEFINNHAYAGGAIENYGSINNLNGNFSANTATYGGAIDNFAVISKINGDFNSNVAQLGGGAIVNNKTGTITEITANFIANQALVGGAILNNGTIGSITGDFIENVASNGGAINNNGGSISSISGQFTNNIGVNGGAIYNTDIIDQSTGEVAQEGVIGEINSDFTGNIVQTSELLSGGGAIFNTNGGTIISIDGDFTENGVLVGGLGGGGAIYNGNNATIGNIVSNFVGNKALSSNQTAISGGGAIFNTGVILTISGNFIENESSLFGGAIYNLNVIGDITGNFNKNNALVGNGGAINNNGGINSITGDFNENIAFSSGGAIYNNGLLTKISGNFVNNTATGFGGAIYNALIVDQSTGQISSLGQIGAIEGNFIGNKALSNHGGAIYNLGELAQITGDFIQNTAEGNGGAINNTGSMTQITGKFIANQASHGGAVYNDGNIDGFNGDFIQNSATGVVNTLTDSEGNESTFIQSYGGAIVNSGTISAITGNFVENTVNAESTGKATIRAYGGAIYNNGGSIENINGNFIGNATKVSGEEIIEFSQGGAIYNGIVLDLTTTEVILDSDGNPIMGSIENINGDFIQNSAYAGGAIANDANINSITGKFIENTASYGGAIDNFGIINVINGDFINNEAQFGGGAISNNGIAELTELTANFEGNQALAGGAILNNGKIGSISGKFTNNVAVNGGAINNNGGDITALSGDFVQNIGVDGGAIYNTGIINQTDLSIVSEGIIDSINANFIGNIVQSSNLLSGGGAIFNTAGGNIKIINGDFTENGVLVGGLGGGGAIYNDNNAALGAITGNFVGNLALSTSQVAISGGGAIFNSGTIASLTGKFIENETTFFGGAIYNLYQIDEITSDFIGNMVHSGNGGAIYNNDQINNIVGNFIENTAFSTGGAIYNNGLLANIDGNFINNTATGSGGAIYNTKIIEQSTGEVSSIGQIDKISGNFVGNKSLVNQGGAIYNLGEIGEITSQFTENTSASNAGAIYNAGSINSLNADFIGNIADGHGGAIYNDGGSLNYIDGSFINNKAILGQGGAVWTNTDIFFMANNTTNTFSNNMAGQENNAIYVANNSTITFAMQGNGAFAFNDIIDGDAENPYNININGLNYNLNTFALNNNIINAQNINVNGATLRLGGLSNIDSPPYHALANLNIMENSALDINSGNWILGSANFAQNSLLTYNAQELGHGALYLLGSLEVEDGAKLHIDDIESGQSIIVANFDPEASFVAENAWSGENLTFSSEFQRVATAFVNNYYIVSVDKNTLANIQKGFPSLQAKTMGLISSFDFDSESQNYGIRFFSRIVDEIRGIGSNNPRLATVTAESALQAGNIIGVNTSGFSVANTVAKAIITRNSPARIGSQGQGIFTASLDNSGISAGTSIADGNKLAAWFMPLYKHSSVDGLKSGIFENGYTTDLGGISLGADYTFTEKTRIGMAFNAGAGYSENNGDFNNTSNDFEFWGLSLYGAHYIENLALSADIGFNSINGHIEQNVPSALGMGNLSGHTQTNVLTAGVNAEYTFRSELLDVTPYLGVRYMNVHTSSYSMKSAGRSVTNIEADNQDVWYIPAGVIFSRNYDLENGWEITPSFDLGVIAAFGDKEANTEVSIPSVAGSSTYEMQNIDDLAFNGGAGIEFVDDRVKLGLNYNIQASEHETSHMIYGSFRFEF